MTDFDPYDLTEIPLGMPGKLFRSPMPYGAYDPHRQVFLHAREQGVTVIVDLVPDEEAQRKTGLPLRQYYAEQGMEVIYAPIEDFTTPAKGALEPTLAAAAVHLAAGRGLMVHCNAGFGRTGTFLGCLVRRQLGLDGAAAVEWVRKYVPTALENEEQVMYVVNYGGG